VIRIKSDVWVRCAGYDGNLFDYPVKKGVCKLLRGVAYRKHNPVTQSVVIRWVRGLPARHDECRFLMTDLDAGPARISDPYGRRMTVEELFRDHKSKRNGWSLRDTQVSTAGRLDRLLLLLVLALAYILLVGLGLHCRRHYRPGHWCSNNRGDTLSCATSPPPGPCRPRSASCPRPPSACYWPPPSRLYQTGDRSGSGWLVR
jgi:hypothetical protein